MIRVVGWGPGLPKPTDRMPLPRAGAAKGAARQAQQATPDLSFGEKLQAEARASDAKTSAEPSFKDIGKSLSNQFGQKDATDVGKAVKENTPSGSDVKGETPVMLFSFGCAPCTCTCEVELGPALSNPRETLIRR